jgi:outer membrane protein TolC
MPSFRAIDSAPRLLKTSVGLVLLALPSSVAAQQQPVPMPQAPAAAPTQPAPSAPVSLQEAIKRARANEPTFAAAVAAAQNANLDKAIAKAALLPNVTYHNQFLYTQGGAGIITNPVKAAEPDLKTTSAPRFIANNAVHEYMSQGVVNETIGGLQFNAVSKASASLAVANAELEVARRGLVASVVGLYYAASSAERKVAIAERAAKEAADFTSVTQQREGAREAAHADVVKAQLTQQQRDRELQDAQLNADKARLELGVLLFPDPRTPYTVAVSDNPPEPPSRTDVESALAKYNPELQSALASAHLANLNVTSAKLGYLPDLSLNYTYGIDSAQFAMRNDLGDRNLGYSAFATLDIPIWDWFTTRDKVRQAEIARRTARTQLTNTQRKQIANLEEFYAEALAAYKQLESLNLSVTTAADSLRLTRLRYTNGEATVLEVVDAQNSFATAESAREDGLVRYETALANIQTLTGTL